LACPDDRGVSRLQRRQLDAAVRRNAKRWRTDHGLERAAASLGAAAVPTAPAQPATSASAQAPVDQSAGSSGQNALVEAAGPAAPGDIRKLVDENSGAVSLGQRLPSRF